MNLKVQMPIHAHTIVEASHNLSPSSPPSVPSGIAYQPSQSELHPGALMKDSFDYWCLCVLHQKMPSHKGLMMQEQREYLVQSSLVWDIRNLCPIQPTIYKDITC